MTSHWRIRKRWFIRVTVGGKKFERYTPFGSNEGWKRKKDAQAYEPVFLATLTETDPTKSNVTCGDVAPIFLREVKTRVKPSTYYGQESVFRRFILPFFETMRVCDLTNAYIDTVNVAINKRKTNKYQQSCVCRSFLRYLKKTKSDLDPDRISTPKNYHPVDENYQIYSPEDFEKLLSVVTDEKDRFMLTLFFYYGLRCGELQGLKWEDFYGGKLHIRRNVTRRGYKDHDVITTPKTKNSIRDYPIIDPIIPFLESLPRDSEFCFPPCIKADKGAVTMGYSEIRRRVIKYEQLAGLPHMRVHGFRHSCVSWLLSQGMSHRTVARWVGDTEAVILQTYSHLLPDEKDAIADFIKSMTAAKKSES